MKIAVAGAGYVGLSNAILLAQHNTVVLVDPNEEKVKKINDGISPFFDRDITEYLRNQPLDLTATSDEAVAYKDANYVFIAAKKMALTYRLWNRLFTGSNRSRAKLPS